MAKTVKLCRSLGTVDCEQYGVKKLAAVEGCEVAVNDNAADALVARKLATVVELKAVPASDIEAEAPKKSGKDKT